MSYTNEKILRLLKTLAGESERTSRINPKEARARFLQATQDDAAEDERRRIAAKSVTDEVLAIAFAQLDKEKREAKKARSQSSAATSVVPKKKPALPKR
jgi:hypothetical protein